MSLVGRVLNGYQLTAKLGGGGMGAVYAAEKRLGEYCEQRAIKVILSEYARDPDYRRLFLREASSLDSVVHPNIVRYYGAFEEAGELGLVMERLEGVPLSLRAKPLSEVEAVGLVVQACQGVAVLHWQGKVHRDIKPANLFVTKEGVVKLLDFGLTRADSSSATSVMGSCAYMAKEQWEGKPVAASDVYALGLVLYELLLGVHPAVKQWGTVTSVEWLQVHCVRGMPDPGELLSGVSRHLHAVLARAGALEAKDRYPDAGALMQALLRDERSEVRLAGFEGGKRVSGERGKPVVASGGSVVWVGMVVGMGGMLGVGVAGLGYFMIGEKPVKQVVAPTPATPTPVVAGSDWTSPSLGVMKWIPAGTFLMGSPESESGRGDDEVQHKVTLTKGFLLMEQEVTQGQWEAVMGSNPAVADFQGVSLKGANLPIQNVSWEDVQSFIQKVNVRDGVTYRLPTEAEWEYSARGGIASIYAGTSEAESVCQYGNVGDASAKAKWSTWTTFGCNDGYAGLAPVKSFRPNGYGLYDMTGNVWEWVFDWYGAYSSSGGSFKAGADSLSDPHGQDSGSSRVIRGGGWHFYPAYARVALRDFITPSGRLNFLGFRLARSIP
jgi:formylglycine-generating enzyme required for sulfatase activity